VSWVCILKSNLVEESVLRPPPYKRVSV
jgi:hypothetical protein